MPYGIRRKKDRWEIYKKDSGEHVGYSKSKRNASISVWIRERESRKKGEQLHQPPIKSMSDFVRKVNLMCELNEVELEETDIEGKTYARIPDSVFSNLSGSIAMFYGIKKRDNKGWVPKGRLDSLIKLDKEITEDLKNG